MKSLYFIRHGESEFNKANIWAGSSDTPLSDAGYEQAKKVGKILKNKGKAFDIIIASPLTRARKTAEYIADEIDYDKEKIQIHPGLVERNFGILEGNKELIATTEYFSNEKSIDNYDGVEPLEDLQKRMKGVLIYLYSLPHDTILVVGHGASGRALRRAIDKSSISTRGKNIDNAEIVKLI